MNDYTPEKWLWTEADFDELNWHEAHIHALAHEDSTLTFDIDYICLWLGPPPDEPGYRFWISPATLIFENVTDLRLDLASIGIPPIMRVKRTEPQQVPGGATDWHWNVECLAGEIRFRSTGYRLFLRRPPVYTDVEYLSSSQHGGISFAQTTPA